MKTLAEQVQAAHAALLIVDVQNDFVHPDGLYGRMTSAGTGDNPFFPGSGRLWEAYPLIPRAIANLRPLLAAGRAADALIVFVRAIYDPVYIAAPQKVIMEHHGLFGVQCRTDTFGAEFFDDIRPKAGAREVVVTKHRWSGFVGTDLDQVLRSNEIRTIVVTGTATSVCVESTLRDGFFHDYHVVLVEDCCADRSAERHAATVQVVGMAFGFVTTAREVMSVWAERSFDAPR
jgi:ureidoacrylate peracid hydrolase